MRRLWAWPVLAVAGMAVAGCSLTQGDGPASLAPTPVVAAPPPVSYGAFLNGPVGTRLTPDDRNKALAAEQDAVASGQRRTWKGSQGVYGYVEPGPTAAASPVVVADGAAPSPSETCRVFTSTIYIAGRAQVGHGTGCEGPGGAYRITN